MCKGPTLTDTYLFIFDKKYCSTVKAVSLIESRGVTVHKKDGSVFKSRFDMFSVQQWFKPWFTGKTVFLFNKVNIAVTHTADYGAFVIGGRDLKGLCILIQKKCFRTRLELLRPLVEIYEVKRRLTSCQDNRLPYVKWKYLPTVCNIYR